MIRNTVHIKNEAELAETLAQFIHISTNLRLAQRYWQAHYGYPALRNKKAWEKKMDDFLSRIGVTDHLRDGAVEVIQADQVYHQKK